MNYLERYQKNLAIPRENKKKFRCKIILDYNDEEIIIRMKTFRKIYGVKIIGENVPLLAEDHNLNLTIKGFFSLMREIDSSKIISFQKSKYWIIIGVALEEDGQIAYRVTLQKIDKFIV